MNLQEAKVVFSDNAELKINVDDLSSSLSFLISGGQGLKVGETVLIEAQDCVKDSFDLGKGRFSKKTVCVAGVVTDKAGKERAMKFSLNQLKRRTYGKELKVFKEGDYPNVETSNIDLQFKVDKDNEILTLINEVKFRVKKIETHYVSEFDQTANASKKNADGTLVIVAKQTPIFEVI